MLPRAWFQARDSFILATLLTTKCRERRNHRNIEPDKNPDIVFGSVPSLRTMPTPSEHKTVQARILAYAEAIGWTVVPRDEAELRRGLDPDVPSSDRAKNRSLFFDDVHAIRRLGKSLHTMMNFSYDNVRRGSTS